MIQVLVLANGNRDAFADSVSSFKKNLKTSERLQWLVYTASHDEDFIEWVTKNFPWIPEVKHSRFQVREAWGNISPNVDYVVQFGAAHSLKEELDVDAAIGLIDDRPYLAQLTLFNLSVDGEAVKDSAGREWIEHATKWSMQPSIYRRAITDIGWPVGRTPENRFTTKLERNSKSWRYAYLSE